MDDGVVGERDFYRELARLVSCFEPDEVLTRGLGALMRITRAREGVLELVDEDGEATLGFRASEGCDAVRADEIRATMSRGIIAEAMQSGRTIRTASARIDPRFAAFESVQNHDIEAVVCAPIGGDRPIGYVYLQGLDEPGGPGSASDADSPIAFFVDVVGALALGLVARESQRRSAALGRGFEGIVGRSASMRKLAEKARAVAALDVQVLLSGASGTGKTQLARAMHALGPRREKPFVEINCAAIPDGLIESELFGAERGAHSTATRDLPGKVVAAEGGTLFLDEVGELGLGVQAKLLQLLQDREYYPLGSTTKRRADVRMVAATNRDLREAVAAGAFREDLYYRLKVLEIQVPPLADRKDDVAPLAEHFLRCSASRHRLDVRRLSPGALLALELREWPGNVRELAHVVEAATLEASLRGARAVELADLEPGTKSASDAPTLHSATREFQRHFVRRALEANGWNVSDAARSLDVARSHLYNLIRAFGLDRG